MTTDDGATWRQIGRIHQTPDWFCGYPALARLTNDTFLRVYLGAIFEGRSEILGVILWERS